MTEDEEIIQAFLEESRENLDQLDVDLVDLEARPTEGSLLARVFRTVHTIKGTCGFLGFCHLERLSHAGESLLGAARDGDLVLDAAVVTSLLGLIDAIRQILDRIDATGGEGNDSYEGVVADLGRHLSRAPVVAPAELPDDQPTASEPVTVGTESTLRVDVAVMDKLMDLVGELVLTRGQIGEVALADEDGPLAAPYRQLRLVTSELREGVMRSRLQPVGTVTGKLRRVARDLATALGKRLRVELEGEEIGVDRAVNEALRDPLLHLVRNAVDHAIETPTEREAAGKPPEGQLRIRAFHEAGQVFIELSDDGRGVNGTKLVDRAVANGFLTRDEATLLTPRGALELMFRPGLSTKDEVTNISGRGVGMDVVRAKLAEIGGNIDVSSVAGEGTVFRINVPLTLAIMPVLVAWCGGGRYAIPQVHVQEVLRLGAANVPEAVSFVHGARILRLRGRLLPLVDLASHLELTEAPGDGSLLVVVIQCDGRRFGLVVAALGDSIEAVVKPLPGATQSIPLFAGVTILVDGFPALILDPPALATAAGLTSPDVETVPQGAQPTVDGPPTELLLATARDGSRIAVQLADVRRLEHFRLDSVQRSGTRDVVPYCDGLLPLASVATLLSGASAADAGMPSWSGGDEVQVIVCGSPAGPIGLVVERIEDVVAAAAGPLGPSGRRGVSASVLLDDNVTELLDLEVLATDAALGRPA